MKSIKNLAFIGITIFILFSCSIEKRIYVSGYHIDWNKSKNNNPMQHIITKKPIEKQIKISELKTIEQSELAKNLIDNPCAPSTINNNVFASLDNNYHINSNHKLIFFERVDKKLDHYQNSGKRNFDKQSTKKLNTTTNTETNGKNQLIALLLCIFVGGIGIHRFYFGHIGIGVIQLLTLGACGIWTLIDLILIITGDLKPKNGDYEKKL